MGTSVIIDEPVRGSVPPAWFWSLPGIERIRAFGQSLLPAPPVAHLLGIRPGHVGPGSGTWTMPASGWLEVGSGGLGLAPLAEAALTGTAMTTLPPGVTVEPLSLDLAHFRIARPQHGNLLARAQVINASRFFIFTVVAIEDPQGRQLAHGTSQAQVRQIDPPPPPAPAELRPIEEPVYLTPDPYLRPAAGHVIPTEAWESQDGIDLMRELMQPAAAAPQAQLGGYRMQLVNAGRVVMTMPASEWGCRYTRSLTAGMLAEFASSTAFGAGVTLLRSGESFAGLTQSCWLYRDVAADGRLLRVDASAERREQHFLLAEAQLSDADGALVATARVMARAIPRSMRQKRPGSESKRILATLMFTDVVDSTAHAERLGDARWRALLEQHLSAVRAEIARCEGTEVDSAGDGVFARFESPAPALECARAVRERVARLGIEVRTGIHTGECELQGRKVIGMAVHLAARIQALAASGETLVSSTVRDLAVGSDARFEDRGVHALKGVPGEWRLYLVAG